MAKRKSGNDGFTSAATGRSLPMALLRAREAVMERFRPHLARHGVTEQQWRVLRVLSEGDRMEAGAVSERACVLPPSLSRIIKTLQEAGWVEIVRDEADGRRQLSSLTASGRDFLATALPGTAAIYSGIEEDFGGEDLDRLLDMLDDLQRALARKS